jgi:hypothetical protein
MNWSQLQTILWLRTRLAKNQWTRGSGLGAVVAVVVLAATVITGISLFFVGFFAGLVALKAAQPHHIMLVWAVLTFAFLMFWGVGLLTELQRAESIDLQRLMHLPVALGQLFVINYLASHFAISVILTVPAMVGLALGLAFGHSALLGLMLPLALSMVFMVTAWTYCLRGWLAALMTNPRRRRAIIMGITLGFILVFQLPNFYFNVIARGNRTAQPRATTPDEAQRQREARRAVELDRFQQVTVAQQFVPPFWVSVGAQSLAEGRVIPALLGTLGCAALGALGLRRAYRSTLKFYLGETGGQSPAASASKPAKLKAEDRFLERHLPGVPEQATALALASLRSMLRAPEVKMNLATSFVVMVVMFGSMLAGKSSAIPASVTPFIVTGLGAMAVFFVFQFLGNQFGFDRAGFRALVLTPADRRLLLLGKNLAYLPMTALMGLSLVTVAVIYFGLSPLDYGAGLLQFATMLFLAFTVGNLLSIVVPYRIQAGTMKPTKMPTMAMLVMIFAQMLIPIALAPAFLPPAAELLWATAGWPSWVPVSLVLSVVIASGAGALYWFTLAPLARLLQRREMKMLELLSVEVE